MDRPITIGSNVRFGKHVRSSEATEWHTAWILLAGAPPQSSASTLIGIALYFYPKAVVPLIRQYIAEGNNPDQPGRLIQWLYPRTPVYTWQVPGLWYDIGSKETLEEANRIFAKL